MYNSLEILKFLKWMKIYIFMIYSWFIEIDSNWFVNIFDIYVLINFEIICKNIKKYNNVW